MIPDEVRLERNWHVFSGLLRRCESELRRGRTEDAAVAAMSAATFAWCNPTGAFVSGDLEVLLAELGAALPTAVRPSTSSPAGRPRVLHVASQLYQTGGHTQMLANWLLLDGARDHHVCLTGQAGRPIPEKIASALPSDALTMLDDPFHGLVDRAAALRRLTPEYDHVVLHIHPNDVVACMALACRPGGHAQVVLVNHADHVFWIGANVADRILNLRHSGARLNVDRRGIPETRNALLMRPLRLRPRERSREEAKAVLGVAPGTVLVVSAADTYKYGAAKGASLLDVLLPVLRSTRHARLHVAGPLPDGDWSVLAEEDLGRAWGLLPDVRTLLEAADVYVDSYPFSSLTSMLEAASLDVPVLTLREDERLGVLCADTPELDDHLIVASTADELASEVASLLVQPDERTRLGAATGSAVRRSHGDGAWAEQVEKVLVAPPVSGARVLSPDPPRETGPVDRGLLAVTQHSVGQGLAGTLDVMSPLLPWPRRLETAARLLGRRRLRPVLLFPASWNRRVTRWRAAG